MAQGDIGDAGGSFFSEASNTAGASTMSLDLPSSNSNTNEDNCGVLVTIQSKFINVPSQGTFARMRLYTGTTGGAGNGLMEMYSVVRGGGQNEASTFYPTTGDFMPLQNQLVGGVGFNCFIWITGMKYFFERSCSITMMCTNYKQSTNAPQYTQGAGSAYNSTTGQPARMELFTANSALFDDIIMTSYGWGNGNKAS